MTIDISPVPLTAAEPLSLLHASCFPDDPWNVPSMARVLELRGVFGYVASASATPAGFALARDLREECELLALGVLPEYRRNGIGRMLMNAVTGYARARRCLSLVLEVAADNVSAQRLYAGLGFAAVGRRPRYYRRLSETVDALILRLPIA